MSGLKAVVRNIKIREINQRVFSQRFMRFDTPGEYPEEIAADKKNVPIGLLRCQLSASSSLAASGDGAAKQLTQIRSHGLPCLVCCLVTVITFNLRCAHFSSLFMRHFWDQPRRAGRQVASCCLEGGSTHVAYFWTFYFRS